jgi:hypothetical protein
MFRPSSRGTLPHSKYEGEDFEELALNIGFRAVDQADTGKLAREVALFTPGDNGLVPYQKERRDDVVGVRAASSNASHGTALNAFSEANLKRPRAACGGALNPASSHVKFLRDF